MGRYLSTPSPDDFFQNMGPYGSKNFKTLQSPLHFSSYLSQVIMGEYKVMDILPICQKIKILWHFETQDHMGLEISNAPPPTGFIQSEPNFMINKAVIRAYKVMDILAICQFLAIYHKLKSLWHFEILTLESMGKPKMWNITKTVNRRAKQAKIWDSGYYSAHM